MATATKNCGHQQTGWCDDCVTKLQDDLEKSEKQLADAREKAEDLNEKLAAKEDELEYAETLNCDADALDAMLPDEGFDQRAPAGCKIEVVRYADPPECRVRVTLPGGTVEALDLRELPRRYAAMRAEQGKAVKA